MNRRVSADAEMFLSQTGAFTSKAGATCLKVWLS